MKLKPSELDLILLLLLIFVAVLLLGGCSTLERAPVTTGTIDRTSTDIRLTVIPYKHPGELARAHAAMTGHAVMLPNAQGFALWNEGGTAEPWCELHLVMPALDRTDDSSRLTSAGHELMHCIYGTWHAEGGVE